jgi:hypothetical protein
MKVILSIFDRAGGDNAAAWPLADLHAFFDSRPATPAALTWPPHSHLLKAMSMRRVSELLRRSKLPARSNSGS